MAAMVVVESLEAMQFSPQISSIPEGHTVEELSPDCPDKSFYERVGDWHMRHSFDLCDLKNSKIGRPLVETEQRIVIGAHVFRFFRSTSCLVEHPTEGWSIDTARMYAKANNSAGELVHDNENPVALEDQRLATK